MNERDHAALYLKVFDDRSGSLGRVNTPGT
jgi:hypothetical protein